ncbi:hypothetical protein V1527DRAFT_515779 [Lipomyces starkeyi]
MVEHTYYVVEMAKLALILRVQARQKMRGELEFIASPHKQLEEWYSKLPTCLRLDSCSPDTTIQFLASPLALVYNCNLIYPHQPATASFPLSSTIPQDAVTSTSISDLGSSLVTKSALQYLPQDAYGSFFLAIIMLFSDIQGAQSATEVRFLKTHLKICEMIVYQAQEHWDHADWILALSSSLGDKLVSAVEISEPKQQK